MRKTPEPEEIFYKNLISVIENTLINDPNFKNSWTELNYYDREKKMGYPLFLEKAKYILEEIEKTKHLILYDEKLLYVPDIRNKLTPITNMIALFERGEYAYIKNKGLDEVKKSVNYLADRQIYEQTKM